MFVLCLKLVIGKYFGYNYSSVVFFLSGVYFVCMKKIYIYEFLFFKKVEFLSVLWMEEVYILLVDVLWNLGMEVNGVVNIMFLVFKVNLNLMGWIVFSKWLFGEFVIISVLF